MNIKTLFLINSISILLMISGCDNNNGNNDEANKFKAFDTKNMDTTANPGDDFFTYANGTWVKNNPVPADKNRFGAFDELAEKSQNDLKQIIESAAKSKDAKEGSNAQKVGDFYAAGLDSAQISLQGLKLIDEYIEKITNIKTITDVQTVGAYFQTFGINPFFYIYAAQDEKNSEAVIANTWQGGLGLPDRDYYLNAEQHTAKIRDAYVKHIAEMMSLMGERKEIASEAANKIMAIETQFAKASLTKLDCRDPQKVYHKMRLAELTKIAPNMDWSVYFSTIGYPTIKEINIAQPEFIKELNAMMKSVSVDDWKLFLKWKLINATAPYLSDKYVNQDFEFYSKTLSGQEEIAPRWKRVLETTSGALGEVIGQLYVEKYFPPQAKQKMIELVDNLKKSLQKRIQSLSWMENETKKEALAKLKKMAVKVGYPEKWRDYSNLEIKKGEYVTNVLRSNKFEFLFNMDKIGKPVDRTEWGMTPQTVNAYYSSNKNEIVFPAGILQPPFFNLNADDAINYGAIGVVIGHEMTHGFDDQGRQYDKDGNLRDWWTDADSKKFETRTKLLVDQFDKFEVLDSVYVNGKLTLGENIADFGGLTIAYYAYQMAIKGKTVPEPIDGFSHEQRFFLGYAQIWRNTIREKETRRRIKDDVHSPAKERVNGGLFNIPQFYAAFPQIKPTDKLFIAEQKRPVIW